ncbi:spore germination protein GerM [Weizmannia acidilactici]|uniref:Spore germination protein GerM n=1 Tax=Weizmannia acidilactici TaxID=2607726 RepID=A0A5J4JJA8_9BACI|nr:GerMN domain-containing protein [Weizmannia acidilactici]GER68652.1 spore germination protein GerM [Weizmannia acidilactici]GER71861.1 spore germination protein GerM [Weizmannia acidilactici]GER73215.1 spore germination protein GerM [Weizmannia acidilactici]
MLKRSKAAGTIAAVLAASGIYMSGCSLLPDKQPEKIDPHQSVSLKDGTKTAAKAKKGQVLTELYLIDKYGYVVPQTIALPESKSVAKQALEYLVQDGPVSNLLPNGFRAVLPANTQFTLDVKDKVAAVDFSDDFKGYKAADEKKIMESITWTLTQFDSIQKVNLKMNGKALKAMPVAGTPINEDGLTRAVGINTDIDQVADITNTHSVTVYYLAQTGDKEYYVPVTKRVPDKMSDDVEAAVEELVNGPSPSSRLVSGFMDDVKLLNKPEIQAGKVTLNFNKEILGSLDQKMISNEVLKPLVLTLTEQKGIKSVAVEVDGSKKLVTEDGKPLSEPVTRPEKVNTGSF